MGDYVTVFVVVFRGKDKPQIFLKKSSEILRILVLFDLSSVWIKSFRVERIRSIYQCPSEFGVVAL